MARQKRLYQTMGYRQLQSQNTQKRQQLSKEQQQWLKKQGYRNVGWDRVIQLYEKLTEFLLGDSLQDVNLEDLFINVDRIGNKYQTQAEIDDFHQQLAKINQEIADEIDKQFPDNSVEILDFTGKK
jgi:hypothetical protein